MTDSHPWFVPGLRYTGEQTKGACILPKVFVIVNNMVILAGKGDRYMQFVEVRVIGED